MVLGKNVNIIELKISEIIWRLEFESYNINAYVEELLVMSFNDCIWIMKFNNIMQVIPVE
jgi:hypothetical protein